MEVDYTIGRDIQPDDIKKISSTLQEWSDSCETVLKTIENQIDRANSAKLLRLKHTDDLDAEVGILIHLRHCENKKKIIFRLSSSRLQH